MRRVVSGVTLESFPQRVTLPSPSGGDLLVFESGITPMGAMMTVFKDLQALNVSANVPSRQWFGA